MTSAHGKSLLASPKLQITIRLTVGLIFVVALILGWTVFRANAQKAARIAILGAGGSLRYGGQDGTARTSTWPDWMITTIGPDYFDDIVAVNMLGADEGQVTGEVLEKLRPLHKLETLVLSGCKKIDNRNIKILENFSKIKYLDISDTSVTGQGLARLEGLKNLRKLDLGGLYIESKYINKLLKKTKIWDLTMSGPSIDNSVIEALSFNRTITTLRIAKCSADNGGISHLGKMSQLRKLEIFGTEATSLAFVQNLSSLEWLSFCVTNRYIKNDTYINIKFLINIKHLDLSYTNFCDKDIRHFTSLLKLREINLTGTNISDECIELFRDLKNDLLYINVSQTRISDNGLKLLKVLLSRTKVIPESMGNSTIPESMDDTRESILDR